MELQSKLVLENRLASLPDPSKLIDEWFAAPYNLPNTIYEQVNTYLKEIDVRKTFNARKSFLVSGHIKNVMTHSISSSIRYCLVKDLCHPEQKLWQNPYTGFVYTKTVKLQQIINVHVQQARWSSYFQI